MRMLVSRLFIERLPHVTGGEQGPSGVHSRGHEAPPGRFGHLVEPFFRCAADDLAHGQIHLSGEVAHPSYEGIGEEDLDFLHGYLYGMDAALSSSEAGEGDGADEGGVGMVGVGGGEVVHAGGEEAGGVVVGVGLAEEGGAVEGVGALEAVVGRSPWSVYFFILVSPLLPRHPLLPAH